MHVKCLIFINCQLFITYDRIINLLNADYVMIRAITYKIKLNEMQDFIAIVRIKYGMKFRTYEIIMIYDTTRIPFIHIIYYVLLDAL